MMADLAEELLTKDAVEDVVTLEVIHLPKDRTAVYQPLVFLELVAADILALVVMRQV